MNIDSETAVYLLEKFKPLIHKTLQRLNIKQTHMNYDDYHQELQIHLLKIVHTFKNNTFNQKEEGFIFTGYAARCLYFHGINLLRKDSFNSLNTMSDENIEWFIQGNICLSQTTESNLFIEDFLNLAKTRLSSDDYSLLIYLAQGECTMQEIADKLGISRSVVYERKQRVQERLQGIKNCLKD